MPHGVFSTYPSLTFFAMIGAPSRAAMVAGGAMKVLPGVGHVAGALAQGASAGYLAHVFGRALVDYLVGMFGPEAPYWDREAPAIMASGARAS